MKLRYLTLALAFVLIGLAACSRSEAPKPATKKSVAETFSTPKQDAQSTTPIPDDIAVKPVSPDQIPYVGTAPAGQVAFGPSAPGTGMDPVGDRERDQYMQDRLKDNALKEQQERERAQTPAPAPKKNHP